MTDHDMSYLDDIKGLSAYELATMADCNSPDSLDSDGALLLSGVRNAVVEAWEYGSFDRDSDGDDSDVIHEIADNAPSVYNHARALAFVDLCAYMEEPDDGEWSGTLVDMMGQALYQIADRLAHEVIEQVREALNDWVCPDCGDTGKPRVCYPGDCRSSDEDQAEYQAQALATDPFRGHPDYAGEDWQRPYESLPKAGDVSVGIHPRAEAPEPVSDPILTLIAKVEAEAAEAEAVGPEEPSVTQAFMARMSAANIAEFGERARKVKRIKITVCILVILTGAAIIASALAGVL